MKIYIFGSCSGTEPFEGRHHTSFAIEVNKQIYWFDAGEGCSYTAHLMGVDLLSVSDIFISHGHMDHVGGLGNLLWNIRKLTYVEKRLPEYGDITVHMPNDKTFDGVMMILKNSEGNYANDYKTVQKRISDGVIFKDKNVEVCAHHNFHLGKEQEEWKTYSFSVCTEGKKIVYSGDIKSLDDILPLIGDGCDILFMETGHHSAAEVCRRIVDEKINVGDLYFLHHGREIIGNYDGVLEKCRKIYPRTTLCNDRDTFVY